MTNISITKEFALILLLTLFLSLTVNYFHPKGLNLSVPYTPKAIQSETETETITGPKRIALKDAASCYGKSDHLFVDARSKADYQTCHIKNAINLPEHNFDMYLDNFMTQTNPQFTLITYCGSADCPLSIHLAEKTLLYGI
jgi:3-mercaptopyruvate sulfurtransferase SseA